MKKWGLALGIVYCFLATPFALAEESELLLTYKQFTSLTFAEQKTYIKTLRQIMTEMNEISPHLVTSLTQKSGFAALLWQAGILDLVAGADPKIDDSAKVTVVEDFATNSMDYAKDILMTKSPSTEAQKKQMDEYLGQALLHAKLAAFTITRVTDSGKNEAARELLEPTRKYLKDAVEQMKKTYPEGANTFAAEKELENIQRGVLGSDPSGAINSIVRYKDRGNPSAAPNTSATTDTASATATAPAPVAPVAKPSSPAGSAKKESKAEADATIKAAAENVHYRCMYAGFVIKEEPCLAPQKLPWNLNGVSAADFECKNNTVMCNPFVFGVDVSSCSWKGPSGADSEVKACLEKSKPYCVVRSSDATKRCADMSNKDASLESAVYLIINSLENRKAFTDFSNQFGALCHEGLIEINKYAKTKARKTAIQNDIRKTCDNAKKRMTEVKNKFALISDPKRTGGAATGTSTKPASSPADVAR